MVKHLLVPLDGSELAEASLAAAVFITKHFNNRVSFDSCDRRKST